MGKVIDGRYLVESVLDQGGMGDVYLVRHTVMRKRLALKLMRPEFSQVPEFAARFEREAMAAAFILDALDSAVQEQLVLGPK